MSATSWTSKVPDTSEMTDPVRCTHSACGDTYDLATVARIRCGSYAMWNCPKCGKLVDDREETTTPWKSMKDYVRLDQS